MEVAAEDPAVVREAGGRVTELGGDLNYVREAELMHGRQAMLAVVGFVAPALFGKLPVGWTADVSTNPLEAQYQQKIMTEVERYQQLMEEKELLNERWDEQNSLLVESHERLVQELTARREALQLRAFTQPSPGSRMGRGLETR